MVTSQIWLFCIPKILKNESNSQHDWIRACWFDGCFVSQRYWKMKAIHNSCNNNIIFIYVVLYPKDTEKWKQFTTLEQLWIILLKLFCIPKILKNESNSQLAGYSNTFQFCCFVSQRYWKMKAIHNRNSFFINFEHVVLYPKDTEKWKQFTTLQSALLP